MATKTACVTTTTMETYPENVPPPYSDYPPNYEANLLARSSCSSYSSQADNNDHCLQASATSPTCPTAAVDGTLFTPTTHLQLQTAGKRWLSLPFPPPRPDPIPIYDVSANPTIPGFAVGSRGPSTSSSSSSSSSSPEIPLYVSVRPELGSGSCFLVAGDGYHHYQQSSSTTGGDVFNPDDGRPRLSSTTYRFGPGKPPVVKVARHAGLGGGVRCEESDDNDQTAAAAAAVAFEVESVSMVSRAVEMRGGATSLVTGEVEEEKEQDTRLVWRYGSSKERSAAHGVWDSIDVDGKKKKGKDEVGSLLILELHRFCRRSDGPSSPSSSSSSWRRKEISNGKTLVVRRVAQLVRSDALRSPGSSASTAGNGGRLEIDLSWCGDEKSHEAVKVMVVTTALCMLKKEVDRRRAVQFAALSAGVAAGS